MIDLRSDTFTVPTAEMRSFMANAQVGDDVFGEDPSVNELQSYVAELLGKEDALYVASGVMGNQIGIAINVNTGDEVICESQAHIFYYEAAAPSIISRVQMRPLPSDRGMIDLNLLEESIRTSDIHFPRTSLICLENTHNRHGGAVLPLDYLHKVREICDKYNLKLHCDGARLWHACVASGISPKEYSEPFDSVSVCLSKGLGAPVGSLIVSTKDNIVRARKWRKILGGGMRQAGIIASGGLFALKNHYALLENTHNNAKKFASVLGSNPRLSVNPVDTNIVIFKSISDVDGDAIQQQAKENGVAILCLGKNFFRAVFHFQISDGDVMKAADTINNLF